VEKAFAEAYPDTQSLSELARKKHDLSLEELTPEALGELSGKAYKNVRVGLRSLKQALKPGETLTHEYGLYVGPRERQELDRYSLLNFQGVRQYGTFSFLVKFFMWLLGLLKTISLGSWGLAIILLTVVVKVCLHPINKKSQGSMQRFQKKLQKVKPQMDEIKAKFAQNRLKMNQEMQRLFKEHGINPGQQMAGCLILFLQLPIWLGLYYSLQYAIGLRQASFLYVTDLTRPDQLFSFGTSVPFLGTYFNLLPVLYVILTVVNQQLQPKPDDPQMRAQFRMMTFMLVFFGFIFYSFPAGFMFYFMTSSALGIIESKIIKAELARDGELASPASTAPGASGASGTYYPSRPRKPEEDPSRKKKWR
jgi:YidC/Oxa1 family membrane protein insertase